MPSHDTIDDVDSDAESGREKDLEIGGGDVPAVEVPVAKGPTGCVSLSFCATTCLIAP